MTNKHFRSLYIDLDLPTKVGRRMTMYNGLCSAARRRQLIVFACDIDRIFIVSYERLGNLPFVAIHVGIF